MKTVATLLLLASTSTMAMAANDGDAIAQLLVSKMALDISTVIANSCESPSSLKYNQEMIDLAGQILDKGLTQADKQTLYTTVDEQVQEFLATSEGSQRALITVQENLVSNYVEAREWHAIASSLNVPLETFLADKNNPQRNALCAFNDAASKAQYATTTIAKRQFAEMNPSATSQPTRPDTPVPTEPDDTRLTQAYVYYLAATDCYEARKDYQYQLLTSSDLSNAKRQARLSEDAYASRHSQADADAVWGRISALYTTSSALSGSEIPALFKVDTAEIDVLGHPQATAIAAQLGNPLTLNGTTMIARGGATWPSLFGNKDYEGNETICKFVKQNIARQTHENRASQPIERDF